LELRRHGTEPLGFGDGRVKVLHVEVKMDLLGDRVVGPGGRAVTIDMDRTQPHLLGAHPDGLRGCEDELPPSIAAQNSAKGCGSALSRVTNTRRTNDTRRP
jgi:hypothetical protein